MIKDIYNNSNNKIGGMIAFLGLEDFWKLCTTEEQCSLIKYYQSGVGSVSTSSPIEGKIVSTSETKLKYLYSMIGYAVSEKNYALANKIIEYGSSLPQENDDLLDVHYFLQEAAECYYNQRNLKTDALNLAEEYCMQDIKLFPQYKQLMIKEFGCIPRITTIQRLVIIYEKNKQYKEAIDICNMALQYNLKDSTKGGFLPRREKLEKKLAKT